MKVTHVALQPTQASNNAGCPALTPELLAATGARYSRNNEGLDHILARIDPAAPDKSVDSIFRMVDYGHQSIADMAPVAMFIDGITLWLAYFLWAHSPMAAGQESSTRYIRMGAGSLPTADALGIPPDRRDGWRNAMEGSVDAYRKAISLWSDLAAADPELTRIPESVRADTSSRGRKRLDRMQRNYAFDRARYFLPLAAPTNVMLVMSARAWVQLCQLLCSHPLPEATRLGDAVHDTLAFSAPRLIKHAVRTASTAAGLAAEFSRWEQAARQPMPAPADNDASGAADCRAYLDVMSPAETTDRAIADDLAHHDNRYAWVGSTLCRTAVRFGWSAVAMAEIRDLNRHRTGTKHCPLVPQGFYGAADQLPAAPADAGNALRAILPLGAELSGHARRLLAGGDPTFVYWTLLGTQFPFEHVTTADKFIYEAELRTGIGTHYRYARHLRDALACWYDRFPGTRGRILEGAAEPE